MGGCMSKADGRATSGTLNSCPMGDFDPQALDDSVGNVARLEDVKIYVQNTPEPIDENVNPLPNYSKHPPSTTNILNELVKANKFNAFNVFRHRHIILWIDNNYRLQAATKRATEALALTLLNLGKAFDSDMEISFTGYSNKDSPKLSTAKRARAKALDNLWKSGSWDDATKLIEESDELRHNDLKLDKWVQEVESPQQTRADYQSQWSSSSTVTEENNANPKSQRTDREKHTKLLAKVRELQKLYWYGWEQRDISAERLQMLYNEALSAAKEQPKNLNNARFTIEREIALQMRLQSEEEARPTTVLILTGSPLMKSEADAIKKCQQDIKGGASEFSIQTVLFCDHIDQSTRKFYAEIDDKGSGEKDALDVFEFSESRIVGELPSALSWRKILNSHDRSVDNMKFKCENDKYGTKPSAVDGKALILPSVEHIKLALGLDDES